MAVFLGSVKTNNKSKAAKRVLMLMDEDFSYKKAIEIALYENPGINKKKLEIELNKYI